MGNCCGNSNAAKYVDAPCYIAYTLYSLHSSNQRHREEAKSNNEEHKVRSFSDLFDEGVNINPPAEHNEERINFSLL
jgi:hypothetical protein